MKLCVLGSGIGYTLSPRLHNEIFRLLGESGSYGVADVLPSQLPRTVKMLTENYDGFNVTKPYKDEVAEIFNCSSPVNTVDCASGECTSTDPVGFYSHYVSVFGKPCGRILVLGAGGAAKSVCEALGASGALLFAYNRTALKAEQLRKYGAEILTSPEGRFDAVINCTSLGLHGEQAAPPQLSFTGVRFAYDLIYSPPVTKFMQAAADSGAAVSNGLGMLVRQAIAAHEFWRKKKFSENDFELMAENIERELLKERQ